MKYTDITPDQIQDWKAKHGDVISEVAITTASGEIARFVVKPPNRHVMDAVASHAVKKDVAASNKAMLTNCVLGGDMDMIETDGGAYGALLGELRTLVEVQEVTVKKL